MTPNEQNKILDAKIESNVNQYKVDRMNAEISAFSSGDLNKYEFLKRIDLNYKPNALDKATFEFSALCKTFSTGLDKNAQGYQEEGVIKLLKDIRDGLANGVRPLRPDDNNDDNDSDNNDDDDNNDNNDDNNDVLDLETEDYYKKIKNDYDDIIKNLIDKILDLETKLKDSELSNEEKDKLNNEEKDKLYKMLNKFKYNMIKDIDNFNKKSNDYLDIFDKLFGKLSNKILKTEDIIKNNKNLTNTEKKELQNKINELTTQKNNINNEHHIAVNKIKKLKNEKKVYEESYEKLYEYIKKIFEEKKYDEDCIHTRTNDK